MSLLISSLTARPTLVVRTLRVAADAIACRARQLGDVLRHRRAAFELAALDERMLRDFGLTKIDVRDALSEPLWHDPTSLLMMRAAERRVHGRWPKQKSAHDAPPIAPDIVPPMNSITARPD